jgi:hypothetical protein
MNPETDTQTPDWFVDFDEWDYDGDPDLDGVDRERDT